MKADIPHDTKYWACSECGEDTWLEYYMIHNHLWKYITSKHKPARFLCISCVEHRLGRKLTKLDFTSAPVNDLDMGHSEKLLSRLMA